MKLRVQNETNHDLPLFFITINATTITLVPKIRHRKGHTEVQRQGRVNMEAKKSDTAISQGPFGAT